MKKAVYLLTPLSILLVSFSVLSPNLQISEDKPIAELLFEVGEEKPEHWIEYNEEDIKRGYDLIHYGKTTKPGGGRSKSISKFYSCRSCHNIEREDFNLTTVNQEERLQYAIENQIPYLQGSTFWGIVNRETWYNDDYVLKYGDLVRKAEKSLIESTQLCAEVCAQGRRLDQWEVESILAYYWSLQLKIEDLQLSSEELTEISNLKESGQNEELISQLKSKYQQKSPATFSEVPRDKSQGYDYEGRPVLGKAIYDLSCKHCHKPYGVSDVILDDSKQTFRWLRKNMTSSSKLSIYHIIREGTYSEAGHKEYMPLYPLEKLSHQQVEDLRAYIEKEAI